MAEGAELRQLTDDEIRAIGEVAMKVGAQLSSFTHATQDLVSMRDSIDALKRSIDDLATKEEVAEVAQTSWRRVVSIAVAVAILGLVVVGNVVTIQAIRSSAHDDSCAQREDLRAIIRSLSEEDLGERLPPLPEDCR